MRQLARAKPYLLFVAGAASGALISLAVVQRYGILVAILVSLVVLALAIALSVGTADRSN